MELLIRQLQLILNAPVGPLNEVRRQRVAETLGNGFIQQQSPMPNALAFVNPMSRETIFIAENQINYTVDSPKVEFSPDRAMGLLGNVRDVLLLEDRFPVTLQVIVHADAQGSALEHTIDALSPLPAVEMRKHFDGLRGVGLRINFEQPPYTCDFRIEPFFADPAFYFLQLNAHTPSPQSLGRIVEDMEAWLGELRGSLTDFVEVALQ